MSPASSRSFCKKTGAAGFASKEPCAFRRASLMLSGSAFSMPISPFFVAALRSKNACLASGNFSIILRRICSPAWSGSVKTMMPGPLYASSISFQVLFVIPYPCVSIVMASTLFLIAAVSSRPSTTRISRILGRGATAAILDTALFLSCIIGCCPLSDRRYWNRRGL